MKSGRLYRSAPGNGIIVIAATLASAALLTSCASDPRASGPALSGSTVAGTWESPVGSRITFESDGRFSVSNFPYDGSPGRMDHLISGDGKWVISDSGGAANTGVALEFDSKYADLVAGSITKLVSVRNQSTAETDLCTLGDPDDWCAGVVFEKVKD